MSILVEDLRRLVRAAAVQVLVGLFALSSGAAASEVVSPQAKVVALAFDASNHMLIKTYPHALYRSRNGGRDWESIAVPAAVGRYFFGDYCSGDVWSLRIEGGSAVDVRQEPFHVGSLTTFGVDTAGELYLGTGGGRIYKLAA